MVSKHETAQFPLDARLSGSVRDRSIFNISADTQYVHRRYIDACFEEKRGQLCENSGRNFIGALLWRNVQRSTIPLLESLLTSEQQREYLLERFRNATPIYSDLPVFSWNSSHNVYEPVVRQDGTPMRTGAVLMKRLAGKFSGLVIGDSPQGQLSGWLVHPLKGPESNFYQDFSSQEIVKGVCLSRLWNDEPLLPAFPPYSMWSNVGEYFESTSPEEWRAIQSVLNRVHDIWEAEYKRTVRSGPSSTELLKSLLLHRGTRFESKTFQFSQWHDAQAGSGIR